MDTKKLGQVAMSLGSLVHTPILFVALSSDDRIPKGIDWEGRVARVLAWALHRALPQYDLDNLRQDVDALLENRLVKTLLWTRPDDLARMGKAIDELLCAGTEPWEEKEEPTCSEMLGMLYKILGKQD